MLVDRTPIHRNEEVKTLVEQQPSERFTVELAVLDDGEPECTTGVDLFGDDAFDDAGHGLPRGPQQPGDRGLVGALGQPRDHVLEVAGMPSPDRAQGTASVGTRSQRRQRNPRISASSSSLLAPRSRCRQRHTEE